jgi:23S rRNA pseudouridine2605 synthase
VRLNAYLARAGVASRRKADELIKAGRVRVNGEPGQLNTFVGARDRVEVDGQLVERQALAYVLLHKPAGVVTTASDPHGRPTVVDLVDHESRVVPVGRLDADTTGALLLTNDGELAHRLAHPRYEVEKVYEVEVEGEPSDETLRRLQKGIDLDDGVTAPAHARRLSPSKLELAVHEGRKHQVKRMLAAVGHPVRRLHRSRYAGLTLEGLEPGAWRELEPSETARLRSSTPEPPTG